LKQSHEVSQERRGDSSALTVCTPPTTVTPATPASGAPDQKDSDTQSDVITVTAKSLPPAYHEPASVVAKSQPPKSPVEPASKSQKPQRSFKMSNGPNGFSFSMKSSNALTRHGDGMPQVLE
jgi:hypothetical protein